MRYILNSAVITSPGVYEYRHITLEEAKKWLAQGRYESTIGYTETALALTTLTGFPIEVNRKSVSFEPTDEALVFRLTVRLDNPELKGKLTPEFILQNCELGILKRIL